MSCRFGRITALDSISLSVASGFVFGVVGLNGAGKSTLIDVVTGVVRPTSGRAHVLGRDVRRDGATVRALIGVLPHESALYRELTGTQNLRFAAALYGVREPNRRIGEVLDLVGLRERAGDRVGSLSGGMQRRLAIARSMLHDPRS